MRPFIIAALVIVAGFAEYSLHSPAAAAVLPSGSYLSSCRNASAGGGYVYAECQDINGQWHAASLYWRQCPGGLVANNNGTLVCGAGGERIATFLPRGTWRASCRNADKDGPNLSALCETINGSWNQTSIDMRDCPGGLVGNRGGTLVCEGSLPSGSWQATCRSAHRDGYMLYAQCDTGSGSWRDASLNLHECPFWQVSNVRGYLYCADLRRNGDGDRDDNGN